MYKKYFPFIFIFVFSFVFSTHAQLFQGLPDDTKIPVTSATSNRAAQSGEEITKSYDGNQSTIFHTSWYGVVSPATLDYTIEAGQLDYLIYVPRTSGTNGNFGQTEIWVKPVGGDFVKKYDFDFNKSGSPTLVEINEPQVEKVRFVVKTSATDAGGNFYVSCAEMKFYRKSNDSYNPLTLFTNRSCSELKSGITQSQIDACPVLVYRDIATQLLGDTYHKEFRIDSFGAYPDPSIDAAANKTSKYGIMDNPTGIAVTSNDTLLVFVEGIQAGYPVTLKLQTLTMDDPSIGYNAGPEISLQNGVNKVTTGTLNSSTGGLGYIRYYYSGDNKPQNIKVNIYGGVVNGYFDSQKHANSDWSRLRSAATNTFFDLKGKYATVTVPRLYMNIYAATRGLDLINIYDEIVRLEWKYMGLLPAPEGFGGHHRSRAYFVFMAMNPGVGANASDYRTAYPDKQITNPAYILNESGNSRDMIWVFGHEHGHVNQTRPGLKWHGMTEVSNNLHSIFVQTEINKAFPTSKNSELNNRLQKESMRNGGGYVNRYEKAFNEYFAAESITDLAPLAYGTPSMDVFCKLVPLWQIDRYMNKVLGKTGTHGVGFYEDVYEHYRKNDPNATSRTTGQHQLYFVEQICKLANLNLEDFFKRWGFLTPITATIDDYGTSSLVVTQSMINSTLATIRQYPKPEQTAIEYITDANIGIYKTRAELEIGQNAAVYGTKFEGMPAGWTNAVAFEVREDNAAGKLKYVFVPDPSVVSQDFSTSNLSFDPSKDHLYAVSVSGERREVGLSVTPGPTMPQFSNAVEPQWYFIKNCRNSKYLTYINLTTNVYAKVLDSSIRDKQLWRFEGNNETGFRIISKSDDSELKKMTLTQGVRFMPVVSETGDAVFTFEVSSNTTYGKDKWAIRYDSSSGMNANSAKEEEVTTYGITDNGSVWEFTAYSLTTNKEISANHISAYYSNPSGSVYILNKPLKTEVYLYNMQGEQILSSNNSVINTGNIPKGSYIVKVGAENIKFLKY